MESGSPIETGLGFLPEAGPTEEVCQIAEEGPWDYLATGEHIMFHGPATNGMVALAWAAGKTRRVRLLTSITLVPLYPPVLLAKQAAELDRLSGGRLALGVGIGGESPLEFAASGVLRHERGARTDEALVVARRLWSGEEVTFEGRFCRFEKGRLQPPPAQSGGPPIWVAGRAEAAVRRAGRLGDVWYPYLYSPERLARSVLLLREAEAEAGRAPGSVETAVLCFANAGPDAAAAHREAVAAVTHTYQTDFSGPAGRYLVTGTPGTVARRLAELVEAGAGKVVLQPSCPPEEAVTQARRLGEEVVPALRG
jgi:probable F420-dependent oxidoreductase